MRPRPGCGRSPISGSPWAPGLGSSRATRRSGRGCRRRAHGVRCTSSTAGSATCRRPSYTSCGDAPAARRARLRSRLARDPGVWAGLALVGFESVLTIDQATYDAIVAHARKDHPDEACGVVAGPVGSDRPERFIPMVNAEMSPTFFRFDSGEQFRVWREMDDRDEEPVVIYHSHTATEAYPSRTDIA